MLPNKKVRLQTQYDLCVERLYALGLRYQGQLKEIIFEASDGFIGVPISELTVVKDKSLPTAPQRKLPAPSRQRQLRLALMQYQRVNLLLKTLMQ